MGDRGRGKNEKLEEYPEDDLDVEIVDLDALDDRGKKQSSNIYFWSAKPMLRWQRSFNRKRLRITSALCLLFLLLLVLFLNLHPALVALAGLRNNVTSYFVKPPPILMERLPTPVNIKPSVVISPVQFGFSCILDEAWSPDSASIALLGYSNGCNSDGHNQVPGLVTVHDARSGKLVTQLRPDETILRAVHAQFSRLQGMSVISYQWIRWSHSGQHIALPFRVEFFSQSSLATPTLVGLLLVDVSDKHMRVVLQEQEQGYSYVKWDIVRGKAVFGPPEVSGNQASYSSSIPAATEYMWDEHGNLIPQKQASVSSSAPIGDPDGDASFSIWQFGTLNLVSQLQPDGAIYIPGVYVWTTFLGAWSPDERYFFSGVIAARVEPQSQPHPGHKTLVSLHVEALSLLPVRDAALQYVLKTRLPDSAQAGVFYSLFVSWSSDGRLLGVVDAQSPMQDSGSVSLYSSTIGYKVAVLLPANENSSVPSPGENTTFSFISPRWSPDSSQLLWQAPTSRTIVIWHVSQPLK